MCPWCFEALIQHDEELESRWAFLKPERTAGANMVECLNCKKENKPTSDSSKINVDPSKVIVTKPKMVNENFSKQKDTSITKKSDKK